MSSCSHLHTRNRLLALLPAADFALLRPHLELIDLKPRQVLVDYDTPISHAYFPESGIAAMVIASPDGHVAEAHMIGCEGMAGLSIVLFTEQAPVKLFVQIGGRAWRIAAPELQTQLARSPTLHRLLLRYVHTALIQTAYTALSNAAHSVEQRLARWLLMAHDRVDDDEIGFTHEFLALMLNVRRPSVTTALHLLEGDGLIRGSRARVAIRDREGLVSLAHAAYGVPEAAYRRMFGIGDSAPAEPA